jgi:hypothetical protein
VFDCNSFLPTSTSPPDDDDDLDLDLDLNADLTGDLDLGDLKEEREIVGVTTQRALTFTRISGLSLLNSNRLNPVFSIVSDVVRVDLSPGEEKNKASFLKQCKHFCIFPGLQESNSCVRDDAVFQLHFYILRDKIYGNSSSKVNKTLTCSRMDDSVWSNDICKIAINSTTIGENVNNGSSTLPVICFCKLNLLHKSEAYAVRAFQENIVLPPVNLNF